MVNLLPARQSGFHPTQRLDILPKGLARHSTRITRVGLWRVPLRSQGCTNCLRETRSTSERLTGLTTRWALTCKTPQGVHRMARSIVLPTCAATYRRATLRSLPCRCALQAWRVRATWVNRVEHTRRTSPGNDAAELHHYNTSAGPLGFDCSVPLRGTSNIDGIAVPVLRAVFDPIPQAIGGLPRMAGGDFTLAASLSAYLRGRNFACIQRWRRRRVSLRVVPGLCNPSWP